MKCFKLSLLQCCLKRCKLNLNADVGQQLGLPLLASVHFSQLMELVDARLLDPIVCKHLMPWTLESVSLLVALVGTWNGNSFGMHNIDMIW